MVLSMRAAGRENTDGYPLHAPMHYAVRKKGVGSGNTDIFQISGGIVGDGDDRADAAIAGLAATEICGPTPIPDIFTACTADRKVGYSVVVPGSAH